MKSLGLTELESRLIERVDRSEKLSQAALSEIMDIHAQLERSVDVFLKDFDATVTQYQAALHQQQESQAHQETQHLHRIEVLYTDSEQFMRSGADALEKASEAYSKARDMTLQTQSELKQQRIEIQKLKSLCNKTLRRQQAWETRNEETQSCLMRLLQSIQASITKN